MTTAEELLKESAPLYRACVEAAENSARAILQMKCDDQEGDDLIGLEILGDQTAADVINGLADGVDTMPIPRADCTFFGGEAWLRSYTKDGDDLGLDECVVFAAVDAQTRVFATQRFVRTADGVRWIDSDFQIETESEGDLLPAMARLLKKEN
jgi:hypothetical protein